MLNFAVDGITSFSIKPIQLITLMGFVTMCISIVLIIQTIIEYYQGKTVPGWASSYISTWFIGSVQLISLGIVGEYIGKIYLEAKHRPRYHIESFLWKESRDEENKE